MSSGFDKIINDLLQIFQEAGKNKTAPLDAQAEVRRIEGNIAWVHIAGGVDETPVRLTINARVGDKVQVRLGGGRAWITGNATAPPTDDGTAIIAQGTAIQAGQAAGQAQETADVADARAKSAYDYADTAADAAAYAQGEATRANSYANDALGQLGVVENVVGALNWITAHGEYQQVDENETAIVQGKWYYEQVDANTYVIITNVPEDANPYAEGWYELASVDQAVTDYISAHLAVDGQGLWVQDPAMETKVLLSSTEGVIIYGTSGQILGQYGNTAQIGEELGFHIEVTGSELTFYDGKKTTGDDSDPHRIAYMKYNKLYITQATILNQFDIGQSISDGGKGQWSWVIHPNASGNNNLGLKWMG